MPLLWFSLAFLSGILVARSISDFSPWVWLVPGFLSLFLMIIEKKYEGSFPIFRQVREHLGLPFFLLIAGVLVGLLRYQFSQPSLTAADLAYFNDGGLYKITGVVTNDPDRRDEVVFLRISAETLEWLSPEGKQEERVVEGSVMARVSEMENWQYGDRVVIEGLLVTPPEYDDFSYQEYLARQQIYSYIKPSSTVLIEKGKGSAFFRVLYGIRQRAYQVVNLMLPQPEAGLLSGILLGIERDLPADLDRAFRDTGTYHIIAISGFNMAIVAGLFTGLSRRIFSRNWSVWIALIAISCYTLLVGAQPPVVRAAVMGAVGLFGGELGRKQVGVNSLSFVAGLMCFFNPMLPWDVGFQLSFSATLGLVLFGELLQDKFEKWSLDRFGEGLGKKLSGPVTEYFLLTFAAQLMTLPVVMVHFKQVSLSSILANPFILPPQPLVMTMGGLATILGMFYQPLGQVAAFLIWPVLAYTIHMVEIFARIPGGVMPIGEVGILLVVVYYGFLVGFPFVSKFPKFQYHLNPLYILLGLALISFATWRVALSSTNGMMRVTLFNLKDGPVFLIQTVEGRNMIINSSSEINTLADRLGRRMHPFFREVDVLILTQSVRADAVRVLPKGLGRYPVRMALLPEGLLTENHAIPLSQLLKEQNTNHTPLKTGLTMDLGKDAFIEILAQYKSGTATLIGWENFRLLIPDGVPLATLRCEDESQLQGLDVLVLSERDLEKTPVGDWVALKPAVLVLKEFPVDLKAIHPVINFGQKDWLLMETDGNQLWISGTP